MTSRPPESLSCFLEHVSQAAQRALIVLSAAVSLTDDVARLLIEQCAPSKLDTDAIIQCVHGCDFVVERNSEWHLAPAARHYLQTKLREDTELGMQAHSELLQIAAGSNGNIEVPAYLRWMLGSAYHMSAINPEQGLKLYVASYSPEATGQAWLTGVLADEQQQAGLLPPAAIEPSFFMGMTAYQEGRWDDAETHLKRVAGAGQARIETAVACHLLGLMAYKRRYRLDQAEDSLRESLSIGKQIGDRLHQAQVMHTLGRVLQRSKPDEAEALLRGSLSIGKEAGHRHHQAQVTHSLGMLIQRRNPREAEELVQESLSIEKAMGHRLHQAQVMHTLGRLIGRSRPGEAEDLLRESLSIRRQLGDRHGQAQVMHTLGMVIQRSKPDEAENLLRESLSALRKLKDPHGQAQVMHTLGKLIGRSRPDEAEGLLRESLSLLRDLGDQDGQKRVERSLEAFLRQSDRGGSEPRSKNGKE